MRINMPDDVKYIIQTLTENGFEAYAVGGCIRDSIIHREPGDWDITTSARPEQVKQLFRRTIDTGIVHGTVTVMFGKNGYEITTYRVDGEYEDSRHPKNVEFTSSLKEDLRRRDFTINAMAYNPEMGIIDMFVGQKDLKGKIIRCVGDAKERFTEDALRMLRAVRFSAQLGFKIDDTTCRAIKELAPTISKISKERIHAELNKILLSNNPDYIEEAYTLSITEVIFPLYNNLKDKQLILKLLRNLPKKLTYKYAALLYEAGECKARSCLKSLKLDNNTINKVVLLIKYHGISCTNSEAEIRRLINICGIDIFNDVLEFESVFYHVQNNSEMHKNIMQMKKISKEIINRGDCTDLKGLAISGSDLMNYGIKPGKELGEILNKLLQKVLENPSYNTKEKLLQILLKR